MAYLHQMVVNDVGEMIGRQLVGTLVEHLVVEDVALYHHVAADHVVDMDILSRLDEETHYILLAVGDEGFNLLLWHGKRVAHLHAGVCIILEVLYLCTFGVELLRSVEGDVCLAGIQQLVYVLLVDVAALALAVRTIVSAEAHSLVELDAEPLERLDDVFFSTGYETIGVGILDTEHEIAAVLLGEEIVV